MISRLFPPFVSRQDRTVLLWLMASSIEHDRPLVPALLAFRRDCAAGTRPQIDLLVNALESGLPLPSALEGAPALLPADVQLAVRVGADSGALARLLREAVSRQRPGRQAANLASLAWLIYAMFVTVFMLLVTAWMMISLIPRHQKIFDEFGMEIPGLTRMVISVSDLFALYWWLILVLALSGVWLLADLFRRPAGESLPARLATWLRPRRALPALLDVLSLSITAGRPLASTVATLARYHPLPAIRRRLLAVRADLESSGSGWQAFRQHGLLRPAEAAALDAAQRTSSLAWALDQLAETRRRRGRFRLRLLWEFCRPVLLLLLGLVIGTLVVGLFYPLVNLIGGFS